MKGIPLSEPLEASGIFPPMVYHMTGIGEETGNVEEMLEKMADYYDEEHFTMEKTGNLGAYCHDVIMPEGAEFND